MSDSINLSEARKNLPELTDRAYAGQTFILSRRGRKLAVLIGVDEYNRLMEMERLQDERDFEVLLASPDPDAMSEEEAIALAVRAVREVRAVRYDQKAA